MDKPKNRNRILSIALFSLGALLGIAFMTLSTWADLEASLFSSALGTDAQFKGMKCPSIITRDEPGMITAKVTNTLTRNVRPMVRTWVAERFVTLVRQEEAWPTLSPGATGYVQWKFSSKDAVWGIFVLSRVYISATYPVPASSASCGVLVANVSGISGRGFAALLVLISAFCMAGGLILWMHTNLPLKAGYLQAAYVMGGLLVLILLGMLFSIIGLWILAGFCLVLSILLNVASLGYFIRAL
jgi:hypothetical protein